jgi:glycosyltransferase involved in cell wall biosynthesis
MYLQETILSIEAARTANLLEVIIVDDGSTDPGTLKVIDNQQQVGHQVIRQRNQGVAAARNAGIRAARGTYILPVDSDNKIRQVYLDDAVRVLDADPSVGVVYGDAEFCGNKSGRWRVPEFDLARLLRTNYIDACALLRKRMWEDVGGYDEQMPHMGWEDWDLWLRAALKGWRFVHLPQIAFDYRVRAGSLLQHANQHSKALDEYMFSKPEFASIAPLRSDLHRLWLIEQSMEYRLGRGLLKPVRAMMTMFGGGRTRAKGNPVRSRMTTPTVQK